LLDIAIAIYYQRYGEMQAYRKSHRCRQTGSGRSVHLAWDTDLELPLLLILLRPVGLLAHPVNFAMRRWATRACTVAMTEGRLERRCEGWLHAALWVHAGNSHKFDHLHSGIEILNGLMGALIEGDELYDQFALVLHYESQHIDSDKVGSDVSPVSFHLSFVRRT
jgi:hypothetical protein